MNYFILTAILFRRYCQYAHPTDEKTESQKLNNAVEFIQQIN